MIDATPALRFYARRRLRRLDRMDPVAAQQDQLLRLVRRAAPTRFGRDHGFDRIASVADFQAAVPLRSYEQLWSDYWQAAFPRLHDLTWPGLVPYFAVSSGTTSGPTKFIPVTGAMVRANRRAALDVLAFHLRARPDSRVFGGPGFVLGGSTALTMQAPCIFSGDLSGIAAREVPWWARPRYFPPPALALLADWEDKVAQLARRAPSQDLRSISGTPSWLLLFFDRLAALAPGRPRRLAAYWPRLELLVHGGVAFAPYRTRFEGWLHGSHAETREVYPASEGFIAAADRGPDDGLHVMLDNGLFLEFVPVAELGDRQPTRHWLATVEPGIQYAVVVSSCAGLWAYILGDTVRFVDGSRRHLVVTGRTAWTLSAFGEHLIGAEIEQAVAAAAVAIDAALADFTVTPQFPAGSSPGRHVFIVEFATPIADATRLVRFGAVLDRTLSALNLDYAAHRSGDFGMAPPRIEAAPPGSFARWMKGRGKLGGQNKVPRVITDPALLDGLRRVIAGRDMPSA
ncbi:MAG: GH3 auxin-responsive promoter family protein [Azospirillaceae bacterium]|nr:GH3 auxin-responsive promoter family protein [Azospirillaceae bacterium]